MKIKSKVTIGIVFLFIEFLIIGILCLYYFRSMNHNNELVIRNNYNTLQYTENLNQAIDELQSIQTSIFFNKLYHTENNSIDILFKKFEENLKKEEKNITEYGENELVSSLGYKYKKYKLLFSKTTIDSVKNNTSYYFVNVLPLFNEQKAKISSISNLNMQAIIQKNQNLSTMVDHIYKNLSIVLTICFLISVTFMYNFPILIYKPINEIVEKIQGIAENNFKGKLNVPISGEFKDLVNVFNHLTEKLAEKYQPIIIEKEIKSSEKTDLDKILLEKIKTLLGSIGSLMNTISQTGQNESLKNHSARIKLIEDDLANMINQ
jgi:hypothetical protein